MSALKQGFKQAAQAAWNSNPAPGCNEAEAHKRLKTPLCPEPGTWQPAPHSVYQPPMLQVKVTRKQEQYAVSKTDANKYKLRLDFRGRNDARIGTCYGCAGELPCSDPGANKIDAALEGDLFLQQEIAIPWLEPGESLVIPAVPRLSEYWTPGHGYLLNDITAKKSVIERCGDDWTCLYLRGRSTITAALTCENPQGKLVPCSGVQDVEELNNPETVAGS